MFRTLLVTLALVLICAGCAPVPVEPSEEADEALEEPAVQVEPATPAAEADFGYLSGVWTVSATLTDIDQGAMRELADRPAQRWECVVDDGTLTLITDTHTYMGPLEPELDTGWVFIAVAESQDEDGETWINGLEVHGKRTGEATFAGTMQLTVDSAIQGHQFAAEWDLEARRQ